MFQLIYTSTSLIDPERARGELGEIFTTARRNNRALGVTGALLTSGDAFAQVLEGDERTVRDLYERICRDERHERLTLQRSGDVADRVFGRWAMARISDEGRPDTRLLAHARRGVIVTAGGDHHTTDAQEEVLSVMRLAIAPAAQA